MNTQRFLLNYIEKEKEEIKEHKSREQNPAVFSTVVIPKSIPMGFYNALLNYALEGMEDKGEDDCDDSSVEKEK